jgi:PAS domain S-box-containing protein
MIFRHARHNRVLQQGLFAAVMFVFMLTPVMAEKLTLRVGIYDFSPICNSFESNALSTVVPADQGGLFVQLLRHMAMDEQWSLVFVPGRLPDLEESLAEDKIDLLLAVPYQPELEQRMKFSRETVISTWAQIFTSEGQTIQSVLDLAKHSVGLVRDDPYNEELRRVISGFNVECTFVEFNNYGEIFEALGNRWVDAGIIDRFYGYGHEPRGRVAQSPVLFSPVQLRFAASPKAPASLIDAIDYHMAAMKREPKSFYYTQLEHLVSESQHLEIPLIVWWSLGSGAALLLILMGAGMVLRIQVKNRTAELVRKNALLSREIEMRGEAEQALRRQKAYLSALNETTIGLIRRLDLNDLLENMIARSATLLGTSHGFIYLRDEATGEMVMQFAIGVFSQMAGLRTAPTDGLGGMVIKTGRAMLVDDYNQWPGRLPQPAFDELHSTMAVPLKLGTEIAGAVGLAQIDANCAFGEDEQYILERFAQLASIALENAKLYTKLQTELVRRREMEGERQWLVQAIEQSSESVVITGVEGLIQYANAGFLRESEQTLSEMIGKPLAIMQNLFQRRASETAGHHPLTQGTAWTDRVCIRGREGAPHEIEVRILPVRDDNGLVTHYVCLSRDITHELRLERQLRQAQKMEAIGTLAGGIAHDFNNLLFPIMGYAEMMRTALAQDATSQRRISGILEASKRARDLVCQILTFSRQREETNQPLQLQLIIREVLKLLRASIPSTIRIEEAITRTVGCVQADPTQMHQVIMNLCTNSYHAMRETGGVMEIRLDEIEVRQGEMASSTTMLPGWYLRLAVSDSGHGMDRNTLERIFDPFFTTKGPGEGTGMGLSVVHGIVTRLKGYITAYSEPGQGTTFHVYLPRSLQAGAADLTDAHPVAGGGGSESILLVDDEAAVLSMVREMLTDLGYQVTALTSSIEALALFRMQPHGFDLVISDQTMPTMTGAEFAGKLLALRPELPVILCTGFSEVVTREKALAIGIREYIMKPVIRGDLDRAIRRALSNSPAPQLVGV